MCQDRPRVLLVEHLTLVLLLVTLVALSLNRIGWGEDIWTHIKTAEVAFSEGDLLGNWPNSNLFSYTFPDYPLYQQYPVFQGSVFLVQKFSGWEGVSIFHSACWLVIFLVWVSWAGGWRWACHMPLVWLVAVMGMHQRATLRPEVITLMLTAVLLLLLDSYRCTSDSKRRALSLVGVVLVQLLMANTHQMYPLGLVLQLMFLGHLVFVRAIKGRCGVSREDSSVPLWPLLVTLLGSFLICSVNPLGFDIYLAPLQTIATLGHHRHHVHELVPIYEHRYPFILALVSGIIGVWGLLKARKQWQPFELGIWLLGLFMVASAWRGIGFFVIFSVAVFSRCWIRAQYGDRDEGNDAEKQGRGAALSQRSRLGFGRLVVLALTCGLSLFIIYYRWIEPIRGLISVQPGVGPALGQWPVATTEFLRRHPPPGEMINPDWETGSVLIAELFPNKRVFIDPRFEAYPRDFLLRVIAAGDDDTVLKELLEEYKPLWCVGAMRLDSAQKRAAQLLQSGEWHFVAVDTMLYVMVKESPETEHYLAKHRIEPADLSPPDLLRAEPDLFREQLQRMQRFYRHLGLKERYPD